MICRFAPNPDRNSYDKRIKEYLSVTMRGALLAKKGGAKLTFVREGGLKSNPPLGGAAHMDGFFHMKFPVYGSISNLNYGTWV